MQILQLDVTAQMLGSTRLLGSSFMEDKEALKGNCMMLSTMKSQSEIILTIETFIRNNKKDFMLNFLREF